jgi:hypothetical protein
MGGLKSAFKSIKRFVKKNTRDIATVVGFAIGGPIGASIGQGIGSLGEGRDLGDSLKSSLKVYAGAQMAQGAGLEGGQGIGSLNPMGENFMFKPSNIGAGGIDPDTGKFGQFFQDVGASGRDLFSGAEGTKVGSGDLMGSFKDLNMLQKAGVGLIGADVVGGMMGDEEPVTMPGPIDQSGYLTSGLTPAQLSNVYGTQGSGTGIAGSMPSLSQSYDYDPVNSTIAELLRQTQQNELDFPEFARVNVKDGGIARLADGGEMPEIDLRESGGETMDSEGSGDEDTIPALLADGEFVVTKQAVKGIGNGDHDAGIAQLYAMMDMNENKAQSMGLGRA